jgi:hypothetical protein
LIEDLYTFLEIFEQFWFWFVLLSAVLCLSVKVVYDEIQYRIWRRETDEKDKTRQS